MVPTTLALGANGGVFGETCQAQRRGGDVPARIAQQRLVTVGVRAIAAVAPDLVGGAQELRFHPGRTAASAVFASRVAVGETLLVLEQVFGGAVGAIVAAHHQLRVEGVATTHSPSARSLQVDALDSTVVAQAKIDRVAQAEVDHLLASTDLPCSQAMLSTSDSAPEFLTL